MFRNGPVGDTRPGQASIMLTPRSHGSSIVEAPDDPVAAYEMNSKLQEANYILKGKINQMTPPHTNDLSQTKTCMAGSGAGEREAAEASRCQPGNSIAKSIVLSSSRSVQVLFVRL